MSAHPQRFFEFENFLLDSQQRLVFRDGQPLDLTPKVFDLLLELVNSGGRVVEKKELMERVWPDSFVEESNLTQHISTLRKKLGQDSAQQRFILTVPGRGYRFLAPVKSWDDDAMVTVQERVRSRVTISDGANAAARPLIEGVSPLPGASPVTATPARPGTHWILIIGLIACIGGVLLIAKYLRRPVLPPLPFAHIRLSRFTTEGKVVTAAISPNGKQVAYAQDEGGKHSL